MTNISINYDQKFINKSMKSPLLNKKEERVLIKKWLSHKDEKALNIIISTHLRLVISIAHKFKNYGLPIGELIQEGNIGLMQAVDRFDLDRDVRFSTYSSWWIKAAMQSFVLKNWSIVRIGTTAAQKSLFFKLKSMIARIKKDNKIFDDEAQDKLAKEIGVKFKDIEIMKGRLSGTDKSLNAPLVDQSDIEAQDLLIDERPSPEKNAIISLDKEIISKYLRKALNQLPMREQKIIGARQLSDETATLQELGNDLGISKERVRQLEGRALQKLKISIQKKFRERQDILGV